MIDIIKIYNDNQEIYFRPKEIDSYKLLSDVKHEHVAYLNQVSLSDLILEPEYKLIPTLEKSDDYNKAFRKWLEYSCKIKVLHHHGIAIHAGMHPMYKLMLLGYHIEFIKESINAKR